MRITLLIALTIWLAACGQKGALYLPVPGKPPPGADQPACASCAAIKMPASTNSQPGKEQKLILEPQPQTSTKSDKDKDKTTNTDTSTTDSTQETTQ